MSERALVTGGAGFIGSRLVRALLDEGVAVTVLDDLSVGTRAAVPDGADFIEGNVCSVADVGRALNGVDVVFHEAARVTIRGSMREFYEDAETNVLGTVNLLRCCAGTSVGKIVYASSMAVYAEGDGRTPIAESYRTEPISPYGISKLAGEKYCLSFARESGVACHVLRYFNTYGPGQTYTPYVGVITIFINRLLRGETPTIFGDGEQKRDFVHVGDIVQANLLSLRSDAPEAIHNVGTGAATSVRAVAEMLCSKLAPECEPVHAPEQAGELRYSVADIDRIAAALGYEPRGRIDEKIDEVIAYCRQQPAGRPGS